MRSQVVEFLAALGVTGAGDDPLLEYAVHMAVTRICNAVNTAPVPEGLEPMAVQMAVGEYLHMKKGAGQLEGFDLEAAVKQIKEGDTAITFALGEGSLTPEQRLNGLIDYLRGGQMAEIYRFRRLVW